jgi:L-histidine Nalpha-methyltransferase
MSEDHDAFRRDVVQGLTAPQKTLPCKYLYDQTGSELFDRITELDAYYPTRTEREILEQYGHEMAAAIGQHVAIIELGSGSSAKTRLLIDQFEHGRGLAAYVPIDISVEHLEAAADSLGTEYPDLTILPVSADYTAPVELPPLPAETVRKVAFFPGSTIGNFEPEEARAFLERIARMVRPDGGLLIGIDLAKDAAILERAYDDEEGVTAAFNENLLTRIQRELGGELDRAHFVHEARLNESEGRVEMHLVSTCEQDVVIGDVTIHLAEGETIHTENSYKYLEADFKSLAASAGLEFVHGWTDARKWFAVHYYRIAKAEAHD